MSEKFGLDWKRYDNQRMSIFLQILFKKKKIRAGKNTNPMTNFR